VRQPAGWGRPSARAVRTDRGGRLEASRVLDSRGRRWAQAHLTAPSDRIGDPRLTRARLQPTFSILSFAHICDEQWCDYATAKGMSHDIASSFQPSQLLKYRISVFKIKGCVIRTALTRPLRNRTSGKLPLDAKHSAHDQPCPLKPNLYIRNLRFLGGMYQTQTWNTFSEWCERVCVVQPAMKCYPARSRCRSPTASSHNTPTHIKTQLEALLKQNRSRFD